MKLTPTVLFSPQRGQNGCGPACLRMIGGAMGIGETWSAPESQPGYPKEGLTLLELLKTARDCGLHGTAFTSTYEELAVAARLPCLALLNYRHYVVITAIGGDGVELADPACGIRQQERGGFIASWYQPAASEGIWVQFT